jgi:hypothetical protein
MAVSSLKRRGGERELLRPTSEDYKLIKQGLSRKVGTLCGGSVKHFASPCVRLVVDALDAGFPHRVATSRATAAHACGEPSAVHAYACQ